MSLGKQSVGAVGIKDVLEFKLVFLAFDQSLSAALHYCLRCTCTHLLVIKNIAWHSKINNDTPLPIADCLLSDSRRREAFVKEF